MNKEYAGYLLDKTLKDYNLIADDFARSRDFIPEDIKGLAENAEEDDRVLDLGCGNGRFVELMREKGADYYGIDSSEKLIEICQKKYIGARFQVADGFNLPFADNYFDKVFSISVLHHIPSKEFRLKFLAESKRVLKPGGFLVIRVWDFWKRKIFPKLFLKYTFLKLIGKSTLRQAQGCPEIYRRAKLDFFDVFVLWKDSKRNIVIERYFHCFTKKELKDLAKEAGFKIKKSWRLGKDPRSNIYLIAEK